MNKKICFFGLALLGLFFSGFMIQQENNDFYDNLSFRKLEGLTIVEVDGMILNKGKVKLASLPLHRIIVKEARYSKQGKVEFI